MKKLARRVVHCAATVILAVASVGCGGEPADGPEDESSEEALAGDTADVSTSETEADLGPCKPDLQIQPLDNPCVPRKVGWRVVNLGCKAAGPSTATIRFDSDPPKSVAIPALGASAFSATFETKIPSQPDQEVDIRIQADANQDVSESKENNNLHFDACHWN